MKPQHHWDLRAALNFMCGGAGSGLLVFAPLTGNPYQVGLGLALVAAGLFAVWLEIGRKLRALHVLFNPRTSWMTREAFTAAVLFPLALGSMLTGRLLLATALVALAFLYCQARILRAARGIPAWRAPGVVPLIVASGLAEGAALCLLFVPGVHPALAYPVAALVVAAGWRRKFLLVTRSRFQGFSLPRIPVRGTR